MQETRNCENSYTQEFSEVLLPGGESLYECPKSYITDLSKWYIRQFWMCHNVIHMEGTSNITMTGLLYSGTIYDQPAKLIDVFDIILHTYIKMFNLKRKK